ncbi:MAG: Cellulose synthesis regulatory protein [Frankiales bacterium]|nr:Cellulose synthesis regulatory protein [Frankiales bacterium]
MSLRPAFELVEAVQGEEHEAAARAVEAFDDGGRADVRFLLETARTIHAVVRPTGADLRKLTQSLLDTAPDSACAAIALGLQGLVASGEGDTAQLLASTSRAVALLDDESLPAPQRCLAYVISAAALNTLRLWELVDELYAAALADPEAAAEAGQAEVVPLNRVIIGLEHGLSLLECDLVDDATARLRATAELVPDALAADLRPLWRHDALAAADLIRVVLGEPPAVPVPDHVAALEAGRDQEVLPLLLAAEALRAWREAGDSAPADALVDRVSSSSGARSFPLWVRAQVLAERSPSESVTAQREHARLVGRLLWDSRDAVLAAARAQISTERRRADHDRLARAVHTDPLTGLHNRRRFDDWLQRPGTNPVALLLLDLDAFKSVNDRLGHAAGDEVLRRIGFLLRGAVRPGDLAVRQGGDEFALVLRQDDLTSEAVLARCHEIAQAVREEQWGSGLELGVSIGAALALVDVSGQELYAAADAALYRAKRESLPPVLDVLSR